MARLAAEARRGGLRMDGKAGPILELQPVDGFLDEVGAGHMPIDGARLPVMRQRVYKAGLQHRIDLERRDLVRGSSPWPSPFQKCSGQGTDARARIQQTNVAAGWARKDSRRTPPPE